MGAAVSFEMSKPIDANDILSTNSLLFAKAEVIRLRQALGHLAKLAGIEVVVYDASDIVLGENEDEDFHRCVREVSHIRQCLQMHTQSARRRTRISVCLPSNISDFKSEEKKSDYGSKDDDKHNSDSNSDSDSDA